MAKYKFVTHFTELDLQNPKVILNPFYETNDEGIAAQLRKTRDVHEITGVEEQARENIKPSNPTMELIEEMKKRGRPKGIQGPRSVEETK